LIDLFDDLAAADGSGKPACIFCGTGNRPGEVVQHAICLTNFPLFCNLGCGVWAYLKNNKSTRVVCLAKIFACFFNAGHQGKSAIPMVCIPTKPVDQKTLLTAVRAAVKAAGGERISLKKFRALSGMTHNDVLKHHATWGAVLTAAGFNFEQYNRRIGREELLADWAALARKLKHIPGRREYDINGKFSTGTFDREFGVWKKVPHAFRAFAGKSPKWKDILAMLPQPRPAPSSPGDIPRRLYESHSGRIIRKPAPRMADRPTCGEPLDFGGMRRTPVNENGVIFLFGMVAERLGFHIEALQTAFPDCEAKRRVGPSAWQTVRIEFEYESRNFRDHGHSTEGCDLIICWTHNWPDCPAHLEVIALSEELKRLSEHV
jgi:hypothetical protein